MIIVTMIHNDDRTTTMQNSTNGNDNTKIDG